MRSEPERLNTQDVNNDSKEMFMVNERSKSRSPNL